MPSVFISYNWQDKAFAMRLARDLRKNSIGVWIDEDGLKIGDSLPQEIPKAIENNDFVVAIISHNSINSKWVQKELSLALGKEINGEKVVLPVLIQKLVRIKIPPFIRDKLWADFTNSENFDDPLLKLLKIIDIRKGKWDSNFVACDNGVVYDIETGLEWFAGLDKNTTWDEAHVWVESLTVDGGRWRMPTREELRTLYKKKRGIRNMTPLLKTTGWFVWSDDTKEDSLAGYFNFGQGSDYWIVRSHSANTRAFAVRSCEG